MDTPMRKEREKRGWSQQYIADQVGISKVQVSRIERHGVKAASVPIKIAALFDNEITLDQICNPTDVIPTHSGEGA